MHSYTEKRKNDLTGFQIVDLNRDPILIRDNNKNGCFANEFYIDTKPHVLFCLFSDFAVRSDT